MTSPPTKRPITRKLLLRQMKERYEFLLLNDWTYGQYKDEFEFLDQFFGNDEDTEPEISFTLVETDDSLNNERTEQ
jgi:flavodoxin